MRFLLTTMCTATLAVTGPLLLSTPLQAQDPASGRQWRYDTGELIAGKKFRLYNLKNDRSLTCDNKSTPRLAWLKDAIYAGWEFIPYNSNPRIRDHRKVPLVSGQLYWLTFSSQRRSESCGAYFAGGANTSGWRDYLNPVPYRVEFAPGSNEFSLFNHTRARFVVHSDDKVVELKQISSQPPASENSASVILAAEPVINGFVPFRGRFGGGTNFNGVLTRVANHQTGPRLFFVKPNYSSRDCANPDAVIPLAAAQALTSEQMTVLYGAATPNLSTAVNFLVCAATNASSVVLNLRWRAT